MNLTELQTDLRDWALNNQNVLAIGLVGSYARGEENAGSDVDLIVIAVDTSLLLDDVSWISRFGALESARPENYGLVRSLRCKNQKGVELELGVTTVEWCTPPIDPKTASVIGNGLRVIYDPGERLKNALVWVSSNH